MTQGLQTEQTKRRTNGPAALGKHELCGTRPVSHHQCKHAVAAAGENQSQAQADIELVLAETSMIQTRCDTACNSLWAKVALVCRN